jgi:hypothetical protein
MPPGRKYISGAEERKLKQEVLKTASNMPKLTAYIWPQTSNSFSKFPEDFSLLFVLSVLNDISKQKPVYA